MNAADLGLASAIHDAVAAARDDAGADAVVITGLPGCFCAGVDTRAEMRRTINRTPLSLATAIFLILEMNAPMGGLIRVSSGPMWKALEHLAP